MREVGGQRLQVRITDLGFAKERHDRNATTYHLFHKRLRQIPPLLQCCRQLPLVLDLQRNGPGSLRRSYLDTRCGTPH